MIGHREASVVKPTVAVVRRVAVIAGALTAWSVVPVLLER